MPASVGEDPGLVYLLASGGHVIGFSEPLPRPVEEQWERGQLTRVNADGSPFGDDGAGASAPAPDVPQRPPAGAAKKAWLDYALAAGFVSEDNGAANMTRAELQAACTAADPVVRPEG